MLYSLLVLSLLTLFGCSDTTGRVDPPPRSQDQTSAVTKPASLFDVKIGGKWGFIDKSGKLVINPQFDNTGMFSEGLGNVCVGKCGTFGDKPDESKWGFIDAAGKYVVNPAYDFSYPFSEGLAAVCTGGCGYSDDEPARKWDS